MYRTLIIVVVGSIGISLSSGPPASAQEVQQFVPDVVSEGDDGSLSVAYGKLVPLLVEAIKEQQAQIRTLQQELASLKGGD